MRKFFSILLAVTMLAGITAEGSGAIPLRGVTWQWCFVDPGVDFCLDTVRVMSEAGLNCIMPEFGPVLANDAMQNNRRGTFSRDDFRRFLACAAEKDMLVIPYINTLGHGERALIWPEPLSGGIDIGSEADYDLLFSVLDDYIDDFASAGMEIKYFNAGCDEAGKVLEANAEKYGITPAEVLKRHLLKIREYCHSRNIRMAVWHDLLMSSEDPLYDNDMRYSDADRTGCWTCRSELPRDIIIIYWNYGTKNHYNVVSGLADEGFEVWMTPWATDNIKCMIDQADAESLNAVITSTWMESGGKGVPGNNHMTNQRWLAEALMETALCGNDPSQTGTERYFDPAQSLLDMYFPVRQAELESFDFSEDSQIVSDLPGYLAEYAGGCVLLGTWFKSGNNLNDLVPPLTASVGNVSVPVNGCNKERGQSQVILYTREHGPSSGTNQFGIELTADHNGVIVGRTSWDVGDSPIPAAGFVLSCHANSGDKLKAKPGDTIIITDSNGQKFVSGSSVGGCGSFEFPVNAAGSTLHLVLFSMQPDTIDGSETGKVIVTYADGGTLEVPLAYGRDYFAWDAPSMFWGKRENVTVSFICQESEGPRTAKALTLWSLNGLDAGREIAGVTLNCSDPAAGIAVAGWGLER